MAKREGYRSIGRHRKGCHALDAVSRGDWDGPWWMPGDSYFGDKRGAIEGARGSYRWHAFDCNDLDCEARILVREDIIVALVALPHSWNGSRTT